jgi:hypothetical protein
MPSKRVRLKPLSRALRSRVLARRSSVSLSRELEAELFLHAHVLSEGGIRALPRGHDSYFGSTMISVPLAPIAKVVRGDLDEAQRTELLSAASGSVRLRLRAMRLACAEVARRVPDRALGTAQVETRVRITHEQLHIDVDLEVPLGVSFGAKRR